MEWLVAYINHVLRGKWLLELEQAENAGPQLAYKLCCEDPRATRNHKDRKGH